MYGLPYRRLPPATIDLTAAGADWPAAASPDGRIFVWVPGTSGSGIPLARMAAAHPGSIVLAPGAWVLEGSCPSVAPAPVAGASSMSTGFFDTPSGLADCHQTSRRYGWPLAISWPGPCP